MKIKLLTITLVLVGFFGTVYAEDEPEPEQDIPIYYDCGPGTILQDGICVVTLEQESSDSSVKWGGGLSSEKLPPPNLRASCAFDGVIIMWFYQFIVNPLCEIDVKIIPDYDCNCDI